MWSVIAGRLAGIVIAVLVAVGPIWGDERDPLARARHLYNEGRYEAAIMAALEASADPGAANDAWLVLGRAHLELYRQTDAEADLAAARMALRAVDPAILTPRDRLELLVGVAEGLFLEKAFGAAAEVFESVLGRTADAATRDRALDWWATALDRQAQGRAPEERSDLYGRIVSRMEEEVRLDPASTPASYWLAAAARGRGDLERAWHAAVAGWVRAPLTRDPALLRADLDRLVLEGIIPERSRRLARPPRDANGIADGLLREWELVKENWM